MRRAYLGIVQRHMNYLKVDHVWEGSEDGMAEWTDIPNYY